ncbi:MAG: ribosome recycling factor [Thermoflexibacter sp.]|jgi:ribosome recycling factor|nr:ribosome recycling factor [Thermoflexibacter sp.]
MSDINKNLKESEDSMDKALKHTASELQKVRAGKASPNMLDNIMVSYYGQLTPLPQMAAVTATDARTLMVKPWDKGTLIEIERAIQNSDLGVSPKNEGDSLRVSFPPLSEERRKNLVKQVKNEIENGKIKVRNIRKDTNESLKKLIKTGTPEDDVKKAEVSVQALTDKFIKKLDEMLATKEKELLTV